MYFKNPDILYFLFLLIVPIIVHLFQLRRFKIEYFTNVKFLKQLSVQTQKTAKIKKWLLLTARLLLLASIIIAFAQPYFKAKESKSAKNEIYIILDNSYSMQAKGSNGELLKRAVQELLETIPESQQFSLLTNNKTFWDTEINSITKDLQELDYSASPFSLSNLMAIINSKKSNFNKDIIIITDGLGLKKAELKSIKKNDNAYFIIPKSVLQNNVSIDSVYINQNADNYYNISLKLSTYGDKNISVPISLFNKNVLISKTIASLENNKKTIDFSIPKEEFHGYASIDDNGLNYDNKFFFSILKPEKTSVISIGSMPKSNFLARIFTDDEFNFINKELNELDYNLIEKQDAIVINELENIPQALQNTLKSFVDKGGNLIIIPSAECNIENMNSMLLKFGSAKLNALQNQEKLITSINFSHPLFNSVFEKKTNNFQYPNTKAAFKIISNFAPILSYQDQTPFLISLENPLSSVFIFAAPINKLNSNFQNSPLIVPTFYKMAKIHSKNIINALIIDDNKPFFIETILDKDQILEVKNDDQKFIPIQQNLNNKVKMYFADNPQKAGNFNIFNNQTLLENISFNYNRAESNLIRSDKEILSGYKIVDNVDRIFDEIHSVRTDNEFWKIAILLALLFLIAEIFIQKFMK